MSTSAILYIASVITAGGAVLASALLRWNGQDLPLFVALLVLTLILSTMKVSLPRVTSTIAGGFLPVLVSIALLSSAHAVVLAAVSAAVQTMWRARVRPEAVQVAFNVAVLSISALSAWHAARLTGQVSLIVHLTIAVIVNYLVDVLLVSTVLCLIEERPLSDILQSCNFWSLPYYFVGALIAAVVAGAGSNAFWPVLPATAMMYGVYQFYSEYVNRLARE